MTSSFRLELQAFAGSLEDLVLEVRKDRSLLERLPLEPIARQLVGYLRRQGARQPLDRQMEWLDLAALLIRWKSILLVSADSGHGKEVEKQLRAEIGAKFTEIERAYLRHLRESLMERLLRAGGTIEAAPQWEDFRPQPEEVDLFPSLWTLRKKFQTLRQQALDRRQRHQQTQRFLEAEKEAPSVAEMQIWLSDQLQGVPAGEPVNTDQLFESAGSIPRQAALFLAILAMTKGQLLTLQQQPDAPLFLISDLPYSRELVFF